MTTPTLPLESRLREKSDRIIEEFGDNLSHTDRDLVEANVVRWVLGGEKTG
ncbi:hypothetical protein [Haladaptatus sp. DFWS20]|uniref:hypothetical protein n=1 Tax=Haladaptatus sp. DFWS20 TaxID=3403467 RepID=UPI003EB74150